MEDKGEKKSKIVWLYVVIVVLAVLLVFQTGVLLFRSSKKSVRQIHPSHSRFFEDPDSFSAGSPLVRRFSRGGWASDPLGDYFREMESMMEHMGQVFDHAMTYRSPTMQAPGGGLMYDFSPSIDLEETQDAYVVRGDLPGLEKDMIDVTVRGQLLKIQGTRERGSTTEDERYGFYAQERSYGLFARSLTLPGPVDESGVQAEYENGVLTIRIPKAAGEKDIQRIPIQ